jgi:hypothetical protein
MLAACALLDSICEARPRFRLRVRCGARNVLILMNGNRLMNKDMRDSANRRFEVKSESQRKANAAAQERESAAREIRAKTDRLRALRLAKEEAERVAQAALLVEGAVSAKS